MKGKYKILLSLFFLSFTCYCLVDFLKPAREDQFCQPPASGFKAWKDGVVTVLSPLLERNCTKLFAGDEEEILRIGKSGKWKNTLTDGELLRQTASCGWVRGYFAGNLYVTELERSFPVAFTFVVHNSPQQVLRLLKFLYRPMNTYCIHPDLKSSKLFYDVFSNIAACLDNVIIPSKLVDVKWGLPSILEAQMSCLTELLRFRSTQLNHQKWKYVMNLCGKELPLVSTHTMVSYITKLNGSSTIRTEKLNPRGRQALMRLKGNTVPFNLSLYKSSTYMTLSYRFAHHLVSNSTAIKLYEFFSNCQNPEEHYYATVYMSPGTPGGFNPDIPQEVHFDTAKALWLIRKGHKPCMGKNIRSVCIVNVGNLKGILEKDERRALFQNKYFMELDHTIMDCMEEMLVEENRREFEEDCSNGSCAHSHSIQSCSD
jgi:hypothetical protein